MYVANFGSGTVTVLEIDPRSGALDSAHEAAVIPGAACVVPGPAATR
jgi:6-phosphogluconolactonase (cycloisomerase 2 family)